LGHKNSKTTEIYTHVSTKSLGKIKSPLDDLNLNEGGKGTKEARGLKAEKLQPEMKYPK